MNMNVDKDYNTYIRWVKIFKVTNVPNKYSDIYLKLLKYFENVNMYKPIEEETNLIYLGYSESNTTFAGFRGDVNLYSDFTHMFPDFLRYDKRIDRKIYIHFINEKFKTNFEYLANVNAKNSTLNNKDKKKLIKTIL